LSTYTCLLSSVCPWRVTLVCICVLVPAIILWLLTVTHICTESFELTTNKKSGNKVFISLFNSYVKLYTKSLRIGDISTKARPRYHL